MPRILLTEEQKKAKKKAYDKKYREENKEKIKKYKEKNKEQIKEKMKKWRDANKAYSKEYRQTEKGKRKQRIANWKNSGMIEPDGGWDKFMDKVENTKNCELCDIVLTIDKRNTKTTRCVDHSHITGIFRNVVCNSCNRKLLQGT